MLSMIDQNWNLDFAMARLNIFFILLPSKFTITVIQPTHSPASRVCPRGADGVEPSLPTSRWPETGRQQRATGRRLQSAVMTLKSLETPIQLTIY